MWTRCLDTLSGDVARCAAGSPWSRASATPGAGELGLARLTSRTTSPQAAELSNQAENTQPNPLQQ